MTLTGKVVLVGAGPGDPELITVKGLAAIRKADVIIHDRLIPLALLKEARADAEIIDAGKQKHDHTLTQSEINALLVEKATAGKLVVRLKGGDPFVFGRGGEEALYCRAARVDVEYVAGVTSATSVPAAVGIPVTHREMASAFTVFTGHNRPGEGEIDYHSLAAASRLGTVILLMGATYLSDIVDELIARGISPDIPSAAIEWGTTPQQREVRSPLKDLPASVSREGMDSPLITVIGHVVDLSSVFE